MLENIREKSQGGIAKVILGFIIITFAVAGIGSYSNSVDTSVAEVNGEKISQNEFNKAYQNQRSRMAQQFGEMFETLAADSAYMENFRNGVLDNLINNTLLEQNAEELALKISDKALKESIRIMPEFQVDGVFDNNRYLAVINQAGFFQSSDFRDYLRVEMVRRQLSQSLVTSEFNLPYQEEILSALQNQKRDFRFAIISAEKFKTQMDINADELTNYYLANQSRFEIKEQVKVDYLLLDVNEIAKSIDVSEEEVTTYYQDNIAAYSQEEQRRVSHILIELGEDETVTEKAATAILTRIQQGEDFAELAKELSADTFSGENGGDLEWIEAGVMDASFDERAFALINVGDVSNVVKTEFGFHIIKLTDLKAEKITPLSDIRDELLAKVSHEKAQDKFFALQQEMAEVSFEFPDSLDDAAQAVNVSIKTSEWLTRDNQSMLFNGASAVETIFSESVLNENVNSDVIEVSDNTAIVVRLNEYKAAQVKPLSDVEAQIKTQLIADKASAQALKTSNELLTLLKGKSDITAILLENEASFIEKTGLSRLGNDDVEQSIRREAFVLPHPNDESVSASTVMLANGDIAVIELLAVQEGQAIADPSLTEQQTSQLAQSAYKSYVESLKAKAKIVRNSIADESTSIF